MSECLGAPFYLIGRGFRVCYRWCCPRNLEFSEIVLLSLVLDVAGTHSAAMSARNTDDQKLSSYPDVMA